MADKKTKPKNSNVQKSLDLLGDVTKLPQDVARSGLNLLGDVSAAPSELIKKHTGFSGPDRRFYKGFKEPLDPDTGKEMDDKKRSAWQSAIDSRILDADFKIP